ncbi:hypothetical protein [Stratiformator vulcanicus]|uniref:Uncharacterized protein n=1 Tax=Stratiformator vulcanicus TaxID=2527980 RepID=A0A517QXH3_9PLAN|nr:hypothetical protein [Stratiformator vulcanicus]QDT36314.1 hypothetical protein Pan189_06700 [Stratiformator vulcanicus]
MDGDSSAMDGPSFPPGRRHRRFPLTRIDGIALATMSIAAALLAIVHLAPKAVRLDELTTAYRSDHLKLVELARQVERLESIAGTLRNDPGFAEQIARIEFAAGRQGEEVIPVDPSLRLKSQPSFSPMDEPVTSVVRGSTAAMLLRPIAESSVIRCTAVVIAASLMVFGLILSSDRSEGEVKAATSNLAAWTRRGLRRYRRSGPHR